MKKLVLSLLFAVSVLTSWAYDFSAVAPSGQTLYYNIFGSTASVTYPGSSSYYSFWSSYTTPAGDLTIPSSVTYNGIAYSVTSIGDYAFSNCISLASVTIPNSVTDIGEFAFDHCSGLTSVIIPNSVTSIGYAAFTGCRRMASVTISNSITSIAHGTFSDCDSLTSVIIPSSVTSIGDYAFAYCPSLTSVTIPNSVTSIGEWAFNACTSLTSLTIPNSVTTIGESAFNFCVSLTSLTIPNSVISFGYGAFDFVRNIDYHGTAAGAPWGALSMNGYVEHPLVFSDNTKTHLICCSADASSVTIPASVTSIGDYAFWLLEGLTSVTIPNSVTSIGEWAFGDCFSLDTLVCKASTPPTVGDSYTFVGVPTSCKVFVPCGSADAYRSAMGWDRFANFIESPSYSISVASADNTMGSASITQQPTCTLPAIVEATPANIHNFLCWSDGNADNPRTIAPTQDIALIAFFAPTMYVVHDTVAIQDTIIVHDTVTVQDTAYVYVSGTMFTTIYLRDSIIMHDCASSLHDTIFVYDTVRDCHEQQLYIIANNDTMGVCAGSGYFPRGAEVQIMAIPNRGFRFVSWSDGNTQNPRPVTINHNIHLTAIFEQSEE